MQKNTLAVCVKSAALATCVALTQPASAGYLSLGGPSTIGAPSDFTTLTTAWDPGAGTARSAAGNPAPGAATWSIMGAGIGDSAFGLDPHSGATTSALSALYAGGVDEMTTIGITLDKWAAVSGFSNLGMVADSGASIGDLAAVAGDIRVGAIFIDGSAGSNVLAHAFQPGTVGIFGDTYGGDTHFDNSNSWSDGGAGGTIDFHTVALHEFGHALGLGHSLVVGSVMEAIYAGPRRALHADDIAGIQSIYGAAISVPEPMSLALVGLGLLGIGASRRQPAKHSTTS